MDNGVGIECGNGGLYGGRRQRGKSWDNCNRITIKKNKINKPGHQNRLINTENRLMVARGEGGWGTG